ncbi:CASP-like protein 2B2 isoform X3 [Phalaenopsis equestris]|nr:CASP-like protein 2B2 isoform X2 [Phalaenopsis equestris]XP_020574670.1 CASP-like protein 2B2 isoform X3 [Phalaenopsis equestris]
MTSGEVQIYNSAKGETMALERKLRVGELVLRLAVSGLGVAAAALVGSDSQVKRFFSLEKKARFTDMKVLVFLVVANGAAAGYSLLQGICCVVRMMKGSVVYSKGLAWVIFACDQVMAYVTLSAAAAALQSAVLGQYGQPELQWMKICNFYRKYCTQGGEGLLCAFIASLVLIILSCFSAFNLFRLYGSKKQLRQTSNGS